MRALNPFVSPFVTEIVVDKVCQACVAGKGALETIAKTAEAQRHGVEETASAFIAWVSKYDIGNRDGARMRLRVDGDLDDHEVRRRLKRDFELWTDAGCDSVTFRGVFIDFGGQGSSAPYYL